MCHMTRASASKQRWLICEQTPDNKVFFFYFTFYFFGKRQSLSVDLSRLPCIEYSHRNHAHVKAHAGQS